jgi:2,3-bisphosphoglycerate-independent phosphoglycerate mutase
MEALAAGSTFADQVASVRSQWDAHDFVFMHYKYTDSAGEDGDFAEKVARLEEADVALPSVLDLEPDVLMIAGDHSTPATMAAHSWHPVPFLLHSRWVRGQAETTFDEVSCARGALGTFPAKEALPLAMAHAGRLAKFGA